MKKLLILVVVIVVLLCGFLLFENRAGLVVSPAPSSNPNPNSSSQKVETLVTKLATPWSLAFLPDGEALITLRGGRIKMLDSQMRETSVNIKIGEVKQVVESGLLGIAVDPKFDSNKYIFVYYTYSSNGDNTLNKVVRYKFVNNGLINATTLIDKIPGGTNHDGGRLKFGPDGFLYITTGDSGNPSLSQDKNSLAGKILKVDSSGKPAPGNPFNTQVYSYGHRNPQGIAWDSGNRLFETEHGPLAHDEINFIKMGDNYGWPTIQGTQTRDGIISPLKESGFGTWAPSGAAVYQNRLFYAGLRGTALFETKISGESVGDLKEHFKGEFGRIRDVVLGPDNFLYILTNNTDGRGSPSDTDDRLIKINPQSL